jgi:hypothetical protein
VRPATGAAGRRLRLVLLLLLALVPGLGALVAAPAAADRQIYTFVDERGVTHFTNLPPRDERYQPFRRGIARLLSGADSEALGLRRLIGLTAREPGAASWSRR